MNDIRTRMLLGHEAADSLPHRHVAVVGLGGVGSFAAEALARAGVGQLTLVDCDTVSASNLNRQLCALYSTLGRPKVDVVAARVRDINSALRAIPLPIRIESSSLDLFFATKYDYIIDAIDTVSAKLDLIEGALGRDIPILSALGTGNKLDATRFRITDIAETEICPLARVMRRELRTRGIEHHRVLWSDEPPRTPLPLEAPAEGRRSVPASVSWVPSAAGLLLAGDVVMTLCDIRP